MNEIVETRKFAAQNAWGRGVIYSDISQTIGHTPLVRISNFASKYAAKADVLIKLEFFNPLSSVKDRIGVALIDALEAEGRVVAGRTTLIEPTSGNTGIALAFVAAARGYKLILVMPESMSLERRKILTHLGAQLELTPASGGMSAAVARAEQLASTLPDAVIPGQFVHPANPAIRGSIAENSLTISSGDFALARFARVSSSNACSFSICSMSVQRAAFSRSPA